MAKPRQQQANPTQPSAEAAAPAPESFHFLRNELRVLRGACAEWAAPRYALPLILGLALLTRFLFLGEASVWMDEIVILEEGAAGQFKVVAYKAHSAHLAPVRWMLQTFGATPFVLRFWGAMLGSLAVPVLAMALQLIGGWRVAAGGAALALVSPFLVMYAQDGAFYGGMTFYMAAMLLAYALLFRGAVYTGLLLALVAGLAGVRNHPIFQIPVATMLGGMALATVLFPGLRSGVYTWRPSGWWARPAVPILVVGALAASPWVLRAAPGLVGHVAGLLTPGETSLTNVSFGWPLFRDHLAAFGVSYFRLGALERSLFWLPAAWFVAGMALGARAAQRDRNPAMLGLLGLAIVLPALSYFVLFSLNLNRNFNLRYFTYLVPVYLGVMAVGASEMARLMAGQFRDPRRALMASLALPVLLPAVFLVGYFVADKADYDMATRLVRESYRGERILVPTRNDRMQSQHFLRRANLPAMAPEYAYLNQPAWADLYGGALPFMLSGGERLTILSAWRHVEAPQLWRFLEPLATYKGSSKLGQGHDAWLIRWEEGTEVLMPHLAHDFGDGSRRVLDATTGKLITGRTGVYTPELPPTIEYRFDQAANPPKHTRMSIQPVGDQDFLRDERDNSHEFMVFQPAEGPRHLVINLARRDEADELLAKNSTPIPPGLHVALHVDGALHGVWFVEPGPVEPVQIRVPLELAPGNHRLTISGFQPRLVYTPYLPWLFGGIEWNAGEVAATPPAEIAISPGWTTPRQMPADGLRFQGVPGPVTGDHEARLLVLPGEGASTWAMSGPPMPVASGSLAVCSFRYRLEGVEHYDLTPQVTFLNAAGQQVFSGPVNGPNIRGSFSGAGWERRLIFVPVPKGAAAMAVGLAGWPYPREQSREGRLWIGHIRGANDFPGDGDHQLSAAHFPAVPAAKQ